MLLDFTAEQLPIVKSLFLLTSKPMLYVANVEEDLMASPEESPHYQTVKAIAEKEGAEELDFSRN